jgi:hypothetical protein
MGSSTFTPPELAAGLAIDTQAQFSVFACPQRLQVPIEYREDEVVAVLRSMEHVGLVASIPAMQALLARCALHLSRLPDQEIDSLILLQQISLLLHASAMAQLLLAVG